jgi:hypothetical protein
VNSNTQRPATSPIYITYPSSPFPVPRFPLFPPWILLTGNDGTDPIGPSSSTLSHSSKYQTYFLHFPPLPPLPLLPFPTSQAMSQTSLLPEPLSSRGRGTSRNPSGNHASSSRHPPPTERGGSLKLSVSERECLTRHSGSGKP